MAVLSTTIVMSILICQVSSFVVRDSGLDCESQFKNFEAAFLRDMGAVNNMQERLSPLEKKFKDEGKSSREEYNNYVNLSSSLKKSIDLDRFDVMDVDQDGVLDQKDRNKLDFLSTFYEILYTEDTASLSEISKQEYDRHVNTTYKLYKDYYEYFYLTLDRDGDENLDIDDFNIICNANSK